MAKKKKIEENPKQNEAPATLQPITETLEKNYMPYAMSVIISRALPEIDGFKPAHRKLLYTMFKMGLLTGARTKSANIVGQTMHLNPHGDASIYETMVRLTRSNGALLHPFVDSKGSFGKVFSRDMAYAASRYTEAKLDTFCNELFSGIDKDAVDFIPNYDNTTTEPTLLPTTFPNILVSPNLGIAVSMACNICSFNLAEVCAATVALLKNPKTTVDRILELMPAPDFPTGASILYDREKMKKIYETGDGSFTVRARYEYDKANHAINILEIPYNACIEAIIKKTTEMIKAGKLREISDVRDAVDLNGGKLIVMDLKKDADPDLVIQKLISSTEMQKSFDCNFNMIIEGRPMQLGVKEILGEWIRFRMNCLSREYAFDLGKKEDKLHLLMGLAAILVDIDKAIKIIRNTEKEEDVVPNLAAGFHITKVQAEYIAEIKLRHLNREYILKRIEEIKGLEADIAELREILKDEIKLKGRIITQLQQIAKKYGKPRMTDLIEAEAVQKPDKDIFFENYNCRLVMTYGGYFKKISLQSSRSAEEQKLKEGDFVVYQEDTDNRGDLLFFTDKSQIYRVKVDDFELCKNSSMGEYVPRKLGMDEDEHVIGCKMIYDLVPEHHVVYLFENGKGVRIPVSAYVTKSKRKKISGACSSASRPVGAVYEGEKPTTLLIRSTGGRAMMIKSNLIPEKTTRTSSGVQVMKLGKKNDLLDLATDQVALLGADSAKYKKSSIPSSGAQLDQLAFEF